MTEILEKLVAANIQIVPTTEIPNHFLFERDGCAALVKRKDEGFGQIGAPGMLTEHGFAVLIWRSGQAVLRTKAYEQVASADQVAAIQAFASDLDQALG